MKRIQLDITVEAQPDDSVFTNEQMLGGLLGTVIFRIGEGKTSGQITNKIGDVVGEWQIT